MGTILKFENVNSGYERVRILNGLSFQVEEGEVFGVIGPNGCGKTTMLNTLAGLIRIDGGKIIFDDKDIANLPPFARCKIGIGRTFQVPRPFSQMTVLDNVLVAAIHGAEKNRYKGERYAKKCLEKVGLGDKMNLKAGELTLLDRKKLERARALGTEPRLLLLDEVAAGLTEPEVEEVMKLVAGLKEQNYTIIWIEHIIETMVNSTDRLMCMAEGKNVITGDPKEVIESEIVQELYLGADKED
jgi:branched-chain amino acid transport system ATP-binding protein